jgi:hypothetical protein
VAVRCSLVARVLFPFVFFYLVDDLFSVFLMKRRRQECHRHHRSSPIQSLEEVHQREGGVQNFTTRRRVTENSVVSSSRRRRRPAVVLSLSLSVSLSLWRVRPRNVCRLPEENKR